MHIKNFYSIIAFISFFVGIGFCALYNEWIIFQFPYTSQEKLPTTVIQKKEIILFYFHDNTEKTEKQELLWTENNQHNVMQLINAWLTLLEEEHSISKKISIQSALISPANILYISFDQNFFTKEDPIFKKWMLIEALLKTIAHNGIPVNHVQMLIQHQQLNDVHLDFSLPWPIHGFINH